MIDFNQFPSPCYIMEEELLRKNLCLIKSVADRAGVEIILAFKSFAMWRSFPIFREYIDHSTASSVYWSVGHRKFLGSNSGRGREVDAV